MKPRRILLAVAAVAASAGLLAPSGPAQAATDTLFGTTVYTGDGSSYETALDRQRAKYGSLDIVRTFYPGLPKAWPGPAGLSGGPVVVSFRAAPKAVLAGQYDTFFTSWFAAAPRDRQVFWSFWHEPEDDIADGTFTAADYRAAFRRLDTLADKAANPALRSTTILMNWTINPKSRRNWADYYPGDANVDVIAWDCYNRGDRKGLYQTPQFLMDTMVSISRTHAKPWGIAELGSVLVPGDTGAGRAAWLRDVTAYTRANGASFVSYYDSYGGSIANPEFRLQDAPSISAWKDAIAGR